MSRGVYLDQFRQEEIKIVRSIRSSGSNNAIVINLQEIAKLTACHRLFESNSFLESLPYFLSVILIESTEVCTETIMYVFSVPFDEAVHSLPLGTGFLRIEYMTILEFNDMTSLLILTSLEHHEIGFSTGKV